MNIQVKETDLQVNDQCKGNNQFAGTLASVQFMSISAPSLKHKCNRQRHPISSCVVIQTEQSSIVCLISPFS